MNDQLFFTALIICFAWAIYKSIKTKNERLFYAILVGASIFSAKYPFHVPFEIVFSFNGLLGFGFILYKIAKQKLSKPFSILALFCLITGNIFLLKRFLFPEHSQLWMSIEFAFAVCSFLIFALLLNKILRKKTDNSLIVFDLVLLWFGISLLSHPFFFQ